MTRGHKRLSRSRVFPRHRFAYTFERFSSSLLPDFRKKHRSKPLKPVVTKVRKLDLSIFELGFYFFSSFRAKFEYFRSHPTNIQGWCFWAGRKFKTSLKIVRWDRSHRNFALVCSFKKGLCQFWWSEKLQSTKGTGESIFMVHSNLSLASNNIFSAKKGLSLLTKTMNSTSLYLLTEELMKGKTHRIYEIWKIIKFLIL